MNEQEIAWTIWSRTYELLRIPVTDSTVLWTVFPLAVATMIMLIYFQKYKDEELGWNSAVANSLVALFVSIALLRYVYFMTLPGDVLNFATHISRTVFSLLLFSLTFIMLVVNFQHTLPKKIAYYMSSPLTMNLISYVAVIFVYSTMPFDMMTLVALVLIFAVFRILLYLVQEPLVLFFNHMRRLKKQEKIEDVKSAHKKIQVQKKEIEQKEKKLKTVTLKQLEEQKKHMKKIKKVIKK